ncbi:LysR family transcriptional regulator [Aeromonas veronii]|uniref:LysR family transcriptional regulator n=1 Tax=Aeromonas veronii TaxID=654 RepID=UPI001C5A7D85|nr:LysR family transcriptional regulator [Aeromonas veronii]MBW3781445.1 LysR family transcriptional regulator [Aeromonas veronii]
MLDKVEIKQMRIFLHLVKERNLSRVAEKMGISQQAVSNHLRRIRENFPHELFIRQSVGMQPTDYAYDLATKFEKILADIDAVFAKNDFHPQTSNKEFKIIANEYSQLSIIPNLSKNVFSNAPNVKLTILDFNVDKHFTELANGDADLVIGFDNYIDQGLLRSKLRSDSYICVIGNNSKHVHKISSPQDLTTIPQVQFANNIGNLGYTVNSFLEKKDINQNIIATLPCYTSLQAFMGVNDAFAFIPSAIASIGNFQSIDLGISSVKFNVLVGKHRRSSGNVAINWLLDMVVKSAKQ